jgi:hypothetical protein
MEPKGQHDITLVRDETLEFKLTDKAVIYYRRISSGEHARITARATKRGNLDLALYQSLLLRAAIKGWRGFTDPAGSVPSMAEPGSAEAAAAVDEFVSILPGSLTDELFRKMRDVAALDEALLGN